MSFEDINDIDEVLRTGNLSARDLHQIWEQRQPIPAASGKKGRAASAGDARQIPWLQQDVRLAHLFTKRALEKEEFLLVLDAAREALRLQEGADAKESTTFLHVRMDLAAALTRLGRTRDARDELKPFVAPTVQPPLGRKLKADIFLQLGNILREESHHAAARAAQLKTAEEALGFYQQALKLEPERLEAHVLAASMALIVGDVGSALQTQAHETARHILELTKKLEDEEGPRFRSTWGRAAAHAVLGDIEAAARSFEELSRMQDATTADLAEARYRAQFLAEALDKPRDLFKKTFPPLQLIVFAGHLPDHGATRRVRFPLSAIGAVRDSLRAQLEAMHARVGLVSASAGADLLFIEALRARQGTVHIVLPWSQEEFRRTSIRPYEPAEGQPVWEPLFDQLLPEASTVREIGQVYEPGSDIGWEYMNEVTAGIALYTARASRLDVQPMVLWDGNPGWGAGGTDSFYAFWESQLQLEPIIIRPPDWKPLGPGVIERRGHRCERPIMHQEVKSMLFADIVGYSKLTEKVIPEFVGTFLERVSQLTAESKNAPRNVSTWGDAIYAVFDSTHEAGRFALELVQLVRDGEIEWIEKGLYWEERAEGSADSTKRPLNLRIGLHTGPVVMHYNPLIRQLGFTGTHVTRAARIEPITTPGEIFASEEFAAMAELGSEIERLKAGEDDEAPLDAEQGFICEYAGSMQLAKGYSGRFRIFRVLPNRLLDLEELARAAHDGYCADCRARGETPEKNASLRPWEELPENLKAANRAQVSDIPNKLRFLGFELAPNHGIRASEITMTAEQIEELAIREHERWLQERQRRGWTFAPVRDNARKLHNLLIPWNQLSETERERDRQPVRNLPQMVERAGFRVRRIA